MKQIGGERSDLFSVSAHELARLTQAVALGLLRPSIEIRHEGTTGGLVRFGSLDDVRRIQDYIT